MEQVGEVGASGNADGGDPPETDPVGQGTEGNHGEMPGGKPPEQEGAAGGGESETGLKEEKDELLTMREKPPRDMLERVRDKNDRGLEQDFDLLGPGTRLYLKWPDRFKGRVPAPYNTP